MVVRSREDAQVVGGGDGRSVGRLGVAGSQSVSCNGSLANVVTTLSTDNPALVANCGIEGCDGTLEQIGEQTGVDRRLLVVEVELTAVGLLGWQVVGQDLGFEALGEVVFELELGVEGVGGCPCLGQRQACGCVSVALRGVWKVRSYRRPYRCICPRAW